MIKERIITHKRLKLRSFYTKNNQCFWPQVTVFCGDSDFTPFFDRHRLLFIAQSQAERAHPSQESFDLLIEDFHELPFFEASVDTIICYLNKKLPSVSIFHEFYRILRPCGRLILTINNRYSPSYFFKSRILSDVFLEVETGLQYYDFMISKKISHFYCYNQLSRKKRQWYELFYQRYCSIFAPQYTYICCKKNIPTAIPAYLKLTKQIPLV